MQPFSPASCKNCSLSKLCLPIGLNNEEMDTVNAIIKKRVTLKRGETLYKKNDLFRALFAIRSGSFKALTTQHADQEQITAFYLPGELMGFEAIYEKRYHSTMVALETSSVCEIPFADLLKLSAEIPSLQQQLLSLMSHKMAPDHFININSSAETRVATFLLSLSARFKQRGLSASVFNLSMSRHDIGNYLGLATETTSRVFTNLQQQGILSVERREITINNFRHLQEIVCGEDDGKGGE
jgi:CRP/FNR family transcriptional regulator, anaerobic regulatory protein